MRFKDRKGSQISDKSKEWDLESIQIKCFFLNNQFFCNKLINNNIFYRPIASNTQ